MADYLDWRDLLDTAEEPAAPPSPSPGPDAPVGPGAPALAQALPADLQALLAEKARLEDELRALSGQGKPAAADPRRDLCFPVKVHTKESRIEERRLRRHDEHLRLLAQRAGERAAAARRLEERRELEAAERRREWLQRRIAAIAAAETEAEIAAEAAARPAVADLHQPLLQQVEADVFGGVVGEGLIEYRFGPPLVKGQTGVDPRLAQAGNGAAHLDGGRRIGGDRLRAGLHRVDVQRVAPLVGQAVPQGHGAADAQPFILAGQQPLQGIDVVLRIEAMAAAAAIRFGDAVAPLPGPQRIRFQACLLDDGL